MREVTVDNAEAIFNRSSIISPCLTKRTHCTFAIFQDHLYQEFTVEESFGVEAGNCATIR